MKKRVADIVMDILCQQGITDCFAVVGGGAMHLDNALAVCEKMTKYFNHHEQACAMAAEAYARYSGKVAAVCVTSGPGGTNTLTGVMGAWQDSLPMIVISGQVRYETTIDSCGLPLRHRGLQEFDILGSIKNMTKYSVMIKNPLEIKRELIKAINISRTGRRGPVWIDIPLDIQSASVEESELYPEFTPESIIKINQNEMDSIISELNSAKRPCILAGSGIISSGNRDKFHKAFINSNIPIVGGAWVCDIHSMNVDNYYGISGNIGPRTGNFIIQNADVILVLGSSLAFRQTGFAQEKFAPNARIIMLDVDEAEPCKPGLHIDKFIHADLSDFLDKCIQTTLELVVSKEWKNYCDSLKQKFTPYEALENYDTTERVCSYYFWHEFAKYAKQDTILALGNNTANTAKLQIGISELEQRCLTNYTCGSMGYDLPAAIGAAVASKKEVICATGDGSIMMNLQELQTIKHYNLPVKIVVFSNDGYNAIRQTCKNFFNNTYIGCTEDSGISFPSFEDVAHTFNFDYKLCANGKSVDKSLEWLFESEKPVILEVEQLFDDPVIPKVMSRLKADGTFDTPALHDMAPFLDEKELDSLMLWGNNE